MQSFGLTQQDPAVFGQQRKRQQRFDRFITQDNIADVMNEECDKHNLEELSHEVNLQFVQHKLAPPPAKKTEVYECSIALKIHSPTTTSST